MVCIHDDWWGTAREAFSAKCVITACMLTDIQMSLSDYMLVSCTGFYFPSLMFSEWKLLLWIHVSLPMLRLGLFLVLAIIPDKLFSPSVGFCKATDWTLNDSPVVCLVQWYGWVILQVLSGKNFTFFCTGKMVVIEQLTIQHNLYKMHNKTHVKASLDKWTRVWSKRPE